MSAKKPPAHSKRRCSGTCSWVTKAHPCSREGRGGWWRLWGSSHSFGEQKGEYDKDPSQSIGEWRVSNGDTPTHLGRGGGGLWGPLMLIWRADRVVAPIGLEGRAALWEPLCTCLESGWGSDGWWWAMESLLISLAGRGTLQKPVALIWRGWGGGKCGWATKSLYLSLPWRSLWSPYGVHL